MNKIICRLAQLALILMTLQWGVIGCSGTNEYSNNEEASLSSTSDDPLELEKANSSNAPSLTVSPFSTPNEKWVKNRVLVQPVAGVNDDQVTQILSAHGGKTVGKIAEINVHIIELPANMNEKATAALLSKNPQIKFAEVDAMVAPVQLTNDPYYSSQWHLPKINAPTAWDTSTGSGVIIAILDTGVDSTHPDLAARMVPGYNFYSNNTNTTDVYGHGTKCAGTAAAIGNNTLGTAGVAWNAQIMPIKVASDVDGYGSWSAMASGLNWAADRGARVASISYMTSGSSTVISAAQYFQSKGGVVVTSGGNTGAFDATAANDALVSVSATDSGDNRASWSTYGAYIDVAAPGVGIWTTTVGGGYGAPSGTSFSSPLTAGVVALMFSANPNLSPTQAKSILYSSAADLGTAGWDQYYGHGRVDAAAAVLAAKNAVTNDTQAPSVSITSPTNGSIIKGTVTVNVNATDNLNVARVDLYLAGVLVSSDNLSPYSFNLDTLSKADGVYNLVAQAYDATGNMGTSNPVTVTIDNIVDTVAPVVTISNPVDGATVKNGNVNISAYATDNESVKSISIIIDGVTKSTSSSSSISYTWNTRKYASGTHTIQVNATDASGNVGTKIIQVRK